MAVFCDNLILSQFNKSDSDVSEAEPECIQTVWKIHRLAAGGPKWFTQYKTDVSKNKRCSYW